MNGTPPSPECLREGLALALLPGVGCVSFRQAIERHGSAADAFAESAGTDAGRRALQRADDLISRAAGAGAVIILAGEDSYPEVLLDLPDPPAYLFAIGDAGHLKGPRVGIVGTRHSSGSGERIAHRIAALAARAGAAVISGMALGIDAAAHRGAMDAGGRTVAVLGGGADLPYPPSHATMHRRITSCGLAISEAAIGSRPVKGAFPRRNRIIAALSDLLVVVEAGERSGALITANHALELGRPIAVVPGPIDSPRHAGSNQLLASGAQFIASPEDVLSLASLSLAAVETRAAGPGRSPRTGSDTDEVVARAIQTGAADAEGIARVTDLPARAIAEALSSLELSGRVRVEAGGRIVLGLHAGGSRQATVR